MASTQSPANVTIKWSTAQKKRGMPDEDFNLLDREFNKVMTKTAKQWVTEFAQKANVEIAKAFGSKPFKQIFIHFNGRFTAVGGHCEWISEGSEKAYIMLAPKWSGPCSGLKRMFDVIAHELIHAKQMQKGELKWRQGDFEWMGQRQRKDLGLKYRQFGHEQEAYDNQRKITNAGVDSFFGVGAPSEVFACPHCGKEYQSRQGRYRHLRSKACQ